MIIKRIESDLLLSNMYIVEENGHALVLDPCRDTSHGEGLIVDAILLTHEHYDHISGVNLWKNKFNIPVICSNKCAENIGNPRKNMSRYFDALFEMQNWVKKDKMPDVDHDYTCEAEISFENEIEFFWQKHKIKMFELPGHSQGSCGIFIDNGAFFSGDSVMEHEPIELRFRGGSKKDWEAISLPKLQAIPEGIRVYPGHFNDFCYERNSQL